MSRPHFLARIVVLNLLQDNGPRVLALHWDIFQAAALALVGWYLMVPLPVVGGAAHYDAPLKDWWIVGSFDKAAECAKEQDRSMNAAEEYQRKYSSDSQHAVASLRALGHRFDLCTDGQMSAAACIATDDPRLKGK